MQLDKLDPGQTRSRIRVVIETSRGSRNKYSYEPTERVFVLKKVLPEGHVFPFDFGFIPRTRCEDGDPLDVLVMMDEPAFAGCTVECRLIGVLRVKQEQKGTMIRNDRFVAVAETSLNFKRVRDIKDLDPHMTEQIEHFFASYNEEAGKRFEVERVLGAARAQRLVKSALRE